MTTNHHTPPHQDAGKDPAVVIATLRTMTQQLVSILAGLGASPATCMRVHRHVWGALMRGYSTAMAERRRK